MREVEELTRQWIIKAQHDLKDAENNLSSKEFYTDTICFHCQQACEKLLKGYLFYNKIKFERTHNLEVLLHQCIALDKSFETFKDTLPTLTPYAIEMRYPDDFAEPTIEEAREAYDIALQLNDFISDILKNIL